MKIAFLEFPISLPGGITTFKNNLKVQFEAMGHKVDSYHITLNTNRKPELTGYTGILGFKTKEWLEEYYKTVEQYDYLFFINSCPHLLKDYTDEDWKLCYNVDKPKIAWIHDNYFEKYYPWFAEIPEKYKVKMVFPSDYHYNASTTLKGMKRIIPNIVNFEKPGLYTENKEDLIVDPNEFKSIKFKHLLAEQKDKIKANILMFGHTDSLYFSNYKELFQSSGNLTISNWVPVQEIYNSMKRAKIVVDLARRGNTETIWDTILNEAVSYGCVLLTQSDLCPTFGFKYVKIKSEGELAGRINEIIDNFSNYQKMREYNLNWLNNNLNPKQLFDKLYTYMFEAYKTTEDGLFGLL